MKKQLMKHQWDFILYEENEEKIFDVVFHNSFVDTSKKFKLEDEELNFDFEELKALAEDIRNNYEKYKDREIIG